jgi:hypothetical protein
VVVVVVLMLLLVLVVRTKRHGEAAVRHTIETTETISTSTRYDGSSARMRKPTGGTNPPTL